MLQPGMHLFGKIESIEPKATRGGAGKALLVSVSQENPLAGLVQFWVDEKDAAKVPPVGTAVHVPGVLDVRNGRDADGNYTRSHWWQKSGLPVALKPGS
jgi:hypothetical protein